MSVKRITPPEAATLLGEGWKYIDVRSVPEFDGGHPAGAYNLPIAHLVPGRGMAPNHDFEKVFTRHFGKDDKLVIGCAAGVRSLRVAEMLVAAGYTSVVDMRGGWGGERGVPGWRDAGLPAETATPDRSWAALSTLT
jgi:rhodanese-related sulfurtransferase